MVQLRYQSNFVLIAAVFQGAPSDSMMEKSDDLGLELQMVDFNYKGCLSHLFVGFEGQ